MDKLAALGFIALICWWLCSKGGKTRSASRGMRTVRVHVHGKDRRDAARHEAGHAAVMRKLGARNIRGRINNDGSGWVDGEIPCRTSFAQEIAVSLAGGIREGVNPWTAGQCRGDRFNIDRTLSHVPAGQRSAVRREAERFARHTEFLGHGIRSGYAAGVERRLLRDGRL